VIFGDLRKEVGEASARYAIWMIEFRGNSLPIWQNAVVQLLKEV